MIRTAAGGAINGSKQYVGQQFEEAKIGEHYQQIQNNVAGQYN